MQTLTQLAARSAISSPLLPVECLEKIVEESKVYGVLVRSAVHDQWGSATGMSSYSYEGFYSTREKAERRAFFIYPGVLYQDTESEDENYNGFIEWMHHPTEEKKQGVLAELQCVKIVEVLLSPTHSLDQVQVYFGGCGYVTNIWRSEFEDATVFTINTSNSEHTEFMYEWLYETAAHDDLEKTPGMEQVKVMAEEYNMGWWAEDHL
jgi:hypothetical protein